MWSWERNLSDFLHIFRLDTIRRNITSFALLATLIPSLTMGVLSYTHSKEILAEKTAQELRNATAQVTQELNLWLRERRHESKVFSNSYEVTENLEKSLSGSQRSEAARRLRLYLKSVRARFPDYQELLVVDKKLKVIATSEAKASSIRLPGNWLELAKARKPIFGDPFLEEKGKNVAMMMGVPVQTSRGRILGMLVATVNFQTVEQHLKSSPLADKGIVYLVTRDGSVFIASRILPNGFLVTQLPKETAGALFEKEGAPLQYTDFEEADVIGALTQIPALGWGVVAQISQARAFAPIIESRNLTLMIVGGLMLGIGLTASVLGLMIVRPLDRLAGGAAQVAAGDLEVDLPVVGRGEISYLTSIFNEMVKGLRQGRDELAATNVALSEKNKQLEKLSVTDSLTGLYNRKHLMETLTHEIRRARRHKHSFCVLMLDIDYFKKFNDTYGHLAGDRLLAKAAVLFRAAVREIDYVARYGGEEFLIMLPESNIVQAWQAAERVRIKIAQDAADGQQILQPVTVSIGLAAFPEHGQTPTAMIFAADAALYEAKRLGRNRVVAVATRKSQLEVPS